MKNRPDTEKSRTIEKSRKRVKRLRSDQAEFTETNTSQEKTANRRNKSRIKEKSQPRQESRYLKKTPRSKDNSARLVSKSKVAIPTQESKSKNSFGKIGSRLFLTESNEIPIDLDDSAALGNGMIQDALESTKFVEAKYLEVLSRMQEMKKRDKKFSESRVRTIESTVEKLTKENEHLKYQLSNLQDAIVERKEESDSKKQNTARDIELSIKRFEEKESALYNRIKELELLVKQSGILKSKPPAHQEPKEGSTSNSCSKTTVNHGPKRDKTPVPKRESLLSNKTYNERTPSPGNFKRLLNQAAEQLMNDPFVGHKAASSKAQRQVHSYRGSGAQASLRDAGFSNQQLINSHDTPDTDAIDSVKLTVSEMVKEFKGMRKESREVTSKLANIEKMLERIDANCSAQCRTPFRTGSYDSINRNTDRDSGTYNKQHKHDPKDIYNSLYKKLRESKDRKSSLKSSSALQTHKSQGMRNSPDGNSTSPQVRIHTEARLVRGENSNSVIRADLFGKYGETQPRNSQGRSSNGFSRGSNEPVTFQRSNGTGNKSLGPVHSENDKMDGRNIHADILARTKESGKSGMTWTGQYSQFMHQLERMKQELEAVGEENLELANLISDN